MRSTDTTAEHVLPCMPRLEVVGDPVLDLTNLAYQEVPELATAGYYIQRIMHSFVEHMFNELIERTLRQEPEDEGVVEAIVQAQDAFPHLLPRPLVIGLNPHHNN